MEMRVAYAEQLSNARHEASEAGSLSSEINFRCYETVIVCRQQLVPECLESSLLEFQHQ